MPASRHQAGPKASALWQHPVCARDTGSAEPRASLWASSISPEEEEEELSPGQMQAASWEATAKQVGANVLCKSKQEEHKLELLLWSPGAEISLTFQLTRTHMLSSRETRAAPGCDRALGPGGAGQPESLYKARLQPLRAEPAGCHIRSSQEKLVPLPCAHSWELPPRQRLLQHTPREKRRGSTDCPKATPHPHSPAASSGQGWPRRPLRLPLRTWLAPRLHQPPD